MALFPSCEKNCSVRVGLTRAQIRTMSEQFLDDPGHAREMPAVQFEPTAVLSVRRDDTFLVPPGPIGGLNLVVADRLRASSRFRATPSSATNLRGALMPTAANAQRASTSVTAA